jgi:hypothetical protein
MSARFHSMQRKDRVARRDNALRRPELRRQDDCQRAPSAGIVSAAVKVVDIETRRLIDEALARRAH